LYLRLAAGQNGIQWWRSLVLGFLFSYGTRWAFGWLIYRLLPERQSGQIYLQYLLVWAAFNLVPFDLIFRFMKRPIARFFLVVASEFGNGQLIIHFLWNGINAFPEKPLAIIVLILSIYAFPIALDHLDSLVFEPRRKYMFYPWSYWKRIVIDGIVLLALCQDGFILNKAKMHMYSIVPFNAVALAICKVLDIIVYGNVFEVFDVLMPIELSRILFTYYGEKTD
jgi:hypothetical protein